MRYIIDAVARRILGWLIKGLCMPCQKGEYTLVRHSMYQHLKFVLADESATGEILSVSGSNILAGLINSRKTSVVEANYPEYNVMGLPFEDGRFTYVLLDQVLEHVQGDPFKAVEECRRVLKPGGLFVSATPFLYQIHGYPDDFWRFTPSALKLLCNNFSTVVDIGSWGNRYLWGLSWLGLLGELRVPTAKWHPYHRISLINEKNYPIMTWVVAKK